MFFNTFNMNPIQQQNPNNANTYLPYNSQLDNAFSISSNVNTAVATTNRNLSQQTIDPNISVQEMDPNYYLQPIQEPNSSNVFHVSTTITPLTMPTAPSASVTSEGTQPIQAFSSSISNYPTNSQGMTKFSFFYRPRNDNQMYHINCEEMILSFESISQLINNVDSNPFHNYVQFNNIYIFYHEQTESKKIYKITCKMISHTFMIQFLNKNIYGVGFNQIEQQQQEFSRQHQENLKSHLKKELTHYFASKQIYKQNYDLYNNFIQDFCAYENTIISNANTHNQLQQYNTITLPYDQSSNNSHQMVVFQNGDENCTQSCCKNNISQP